MIPANTELTCPVCDEVNVFDNPLDEEEEVECDFCDAILLVKGDKLVDAEDEADIFVDEDEEEKDKEDDSREIS